MITDSEGGKKLKNGQRKRIASLSDLFRPIGVGWGIYSVHVEKSVVPSPQDMAILRRGTKWNDLKNYSVLGSQ